MGDFIYADDITTCILAPTSTSLNKKSDTCKQYADDVNLTFNASKTKQVPQIFPIDIMHEPIELFLE